MNKFKRLTDQEVLTIIRETEDDMVTPFIDCEGKIYNAFMDGFNLKNKVMNFVRIIEESCESQNGKFETREEPRVCGMTIEQAEKYIYQLETENEKEYVGRGADAYNHCCDELEGWQDERVEKGLDPGPQGTLIGWMGWAQEKMDEDETEDMK